MSKRYEVQTVDSPSYGRNYRVTDTDGDNRIATCFEKEHANLVCKALNFLVDNKMDKRYYVQTVRGEKTATHYEIIDSHFDAAIGQKHFVKVEAELACHELNLLEQRTGGAQ